MSKRPDCYELNQGNEGDEKNKKKITLLEKSSELFFFGMFFYLPKLNVFFLKIGKNSMRALARKKTCFFGNARPKSNARAHLKQRKK